MAGRPPKLQTSAVDDLPRVEAVERALTLLDAFSEERNAMNLQELARASGLYPSTALRLAGSLERFGYLRREADGRFRLGPRVQRLAQVYVRGFSLEEAVRPVLRHLAAESGETAAFYVREGDRRVCLFRVNGSQSVRSHLEEGSVLPLSIGASGHVLMAFTRGQEPRLDAVRQSGLAVSRGERDPDSAAVAAPVFGPGGVFAGALGFSCPITRFDGDRVTQLSLLLKGQARGLTERLQRG